jgi:hypothetical protein
MARAATAIWVCGIAFVLWFASPLARRLPAEQTPGDTSGLYWSEEYPGIYRMNRYGQDFRLDLWRMQLRERCVVTAMAHDCDRCEWTVVCRKEAQ